MVPVGAWPGRAPVDLRWRARDLAIHDDHAAEQEAQGEGYNRGAAGRDAALGQQLDDVGKDCIDRFSGTVAALVDDQELFGEVGGVLQLVRRLSVSRVPGAEAGGRVLGKEAALFAVATASAAALAEVGNVGFGRYIDCG